MEDQLSFFEFDPLRRKSSQNVRNSGIIGPWQSPSGNLDNHQHQQRQNITKTNDSKKQIKQNKENNTEIKQQKSFTTTKNIQSVHCAQKKIVSTHYRRQTTPGKFETKPVHIFKTTLKPTLVRDFSVVAQKVGSFLNIQTKTKRRKRRQLNRKAKSQRFLKGQSKSLRFTSNSNTPRQAVSKACQITIEQKKSMINNLLIEKKNEYKNKMAQRILKKRKNPKFEGQVEPKQRQLKINYQISYSNMLKNGLFQSFTGYQIQQKGQLRKIKFPIFYSIKKQQKDGIYRQFYRKTNNGKQSVNLNDHFTHQF